MSLKQRKKAYEVLILHHAEKLNADGVLMEIETTVLAPPRIILSVDDRDASFQANRLVPEEFAARPDLLEIRIRAF